MKHSKYKIKRRNHSIKKMANIARDVFRTEDVVGRIGGEEFLCVLPRTNTQQSEAIAKRFLKKYAILGLKVSSVS